MKKIAFILPILMLGACARLTGNAYEDEEFYDNAEYGENAGPVADQSAMANPYDNWGNAPQTAMQPMGQAPQGQNVTVSADGTVISLPPQQIYLGNSSVSGQVPAQRQVVDYATLSYSEPRSAQSLQTQQIPVPPPLSAGVQTVTLQNRAYPNTFAQCMATDRNCVASYEQQGYVVLNGMPQFAGYQDVLSPSDYPQNGRWRNGNNIPRW